MLYKIEIIGLGAGDIEQLPLGIYRKLQQETSTIYARTIDHPVIQSLQEEGINFFGFDSYYEKYNDFQTVYEKIVQTLLEEAGKQSIVYAVPGHPMLGERTVQLLLEQGEVKIEIIGGHSYLDALFTTLHIDPIEGFQFLDATSFQREEVHFSHHLIFCQLYDQFVASNVKLTLLEDLPPEYEVILVAGAGTHVETVTKLPLEELDRTMKISNVTSLYVPPVQENLQHHFSTLRSIIRTLRGPDGCPWDRKQTHESLRKYLLEETYELIDAIDKQDDEGMIEELGDVLLQVMLHSQIGEDNGYFTIDDVIKSITKKMIHRHPHVFAKNKVHKTWEELKVEEKNEQHKYLLDSVVKSAPSLQVAEKLQKKAAQVGFDWTNIEDVWDKYHEELQEFHEAVKKEESQEMENEFGDILFVLANIARFHHIHPELALRKTNEKFIFRFNEIEKQVRKSGKKLGEMSLAQLDALWDKAKRKER